MAKRLEKFDPAEDAIAVGRPPEYPWHLWLNGETWEIKQGTEEEVKAGKADFASKIYSMISLIRHTAAQYDIKISIYRSADNKTLTLRPRTEDGEETKSS